MRDYIDHIFRRTRLTEFEVRCRHHSDGRGCGLDLAKTAIGSRTAKVALSGIAVIRVIRSERLLWGAISTDRCNTLGELLCWRLILQGLAGTFVE